MLTITPQQMQALSQDMFVTWMVEHLAEFFAEETAGLDEDDIRSRVSAAVQKARRHGFLHEAEWCRYVDLTFVSGVGFDEEPWASAILGDNRLADSAMKMDLLYEAAQDLCALAASADGPSVEEGGVIQWDSGIV